MQEGELKIFDSSGIYLIEFPLKRIEPDPNKIIMVLTSCSLKVRILHHISPVFEIKSRDKYVVPCDPSPPPSHPPSGQPLNFPVARFPKYNRLTCAAERAVPVR
jgi:hypothetical protein